MRAALARRRRRGWQRRGRRWRGWGGATGMARLHARLEESVEELKNLQKLRRAELESVDNKIHELRSKGVGADIPDTLKLPEMDPEPELQTECADAACLTVDVA